MTSDPASTAPSGGLSTAALIAALVTVTMWGSAFVAIRAADRDFSPGAIALGRLVVSCLILSGVALARRERLPKARDLAAIAGYGVLWLGIYSVALNGAERQVDAGTAAMIINAGPILIAILAGVFLREGFPGRLFAGCAVAFGGCVLIGLTGLASGGRAWLGIGLCVLAALAYAVAVVLQKNVLVRVSPLQVTWLGCVAAAIACAPFAPQLVHQVAHADLGALGWIGYLGAGPTALGFATWTFALRRSKAGQLASVTYLIPIVAIGGGWALLGEVPPLLAIGGGALCLVGVYVASRQPRAKAAVSSADATGTQAPAPI